jgi:hypothetical protein
MAAALRQSVNPFLNQEKNENKNHSVDSGRLRFCSRSELCRQSEYGYVETE